MIVHNKHHRFRLLYFSLFPLRENKVNKGDILYDDDNNDVIT